jgi:hypothetical protein
MKEKILRDLIDLVQCLQKGKVKEKKIENLWREKLIRVQKEIENISKKDLQWLEEEYRIWAEENIVLTDEQKDFFKGIV